jgi:hypothetical protein
MKILLLLLSLTTTAFSFPYSQGMGYPYNLCGDSRCGANNTNYNIQFTSNFGGNWQLTGKRSINKDGSYTDSFRGTVSDTSIQATVTRNDCDWLSDSYWLCMHGYKACTSFSMTISGGQVTGFAMYKP